jgi:hypothetical protein
MKSAAVILVLPFWVNGCSNTISFDVLVAPATSSDIGTSGFVGKLDQIAVYSRYLQVQELRQIMYTKE